MTIRKINENAGARNQRVRVERKVLTSDGMGGAVPSWQELGTFWAGVVPLTGRERDMAGQTESPRNYRVTFLNGLTAQSIQPSDHFVWLKKQSDPSQNVDMNISFIADYGPQDLYISIDAITGVAQ